MKPMVNLLDFIEVFKHLEARKDLTLLIQEQDNFKLLCTQTDNFNEYADVELVQTLYEIEQVVGHYIFDTKKQIDPIADFKFRNQGLKLEKLESKIFNFSYAVSSSMLTVLIAH